MHPKSVELMNTAIADELLAVHQYMYFHFHCDDQGFELLSNIFKRTAIEEMLHVERLAERILFLKGEIKMDMADGFKEIQDPKEMLDLAVKMEESSAKDYNKFANECGKHNDNNTKKLFEELINDEERHFDQYDTELDNLKKFGDNYLALQSIERSKNVSAGTPPAE